MTVIVRYAIPCIHCGPLVARQLPAGDRVRINNDKKTET